MSFENTIPERNCKKVLSEIKTYYDKYGSVDYNDDQDLLQHTLASGYLMKSFVNNPQWIVAAALHDVGHDVSHPEEIGIKNMKDDDHHNVGANMLEKWGFSKLVQDMVRNHVKAKRYLACFDSYYSHISQASKYSLEVQGGKMNAKEIAEFGKDSTFLPSLLLRYVDDHSKFVKNESKKMITWNELMLYCEDVLTSPYDDKKYQLSKAGQNIIKKYSDFQKLIDQSKTF